MQIVAPGIVIHKWAGSAIALGRCVRAEGAMRADRRRFRVSSKPRKYCLHPTSTHAKLRWARARHTPTITSMTIKEDEAERSAPSCPANRLSQRSARN